MNQTNINSIKKKTNNQLKKQYVARYNGSTGTRLSALRYFFGNKQTDTCFGFKGKIYEISKADLMDYFDWLNNLETLSIETKKLKWTILKSFLEYLMEYFDDFMLIIPKKTLNWNKIHKESESNKDVVMTKEEVKQILDYLKINHYIYYLIFRTFAETGMRKGGLRNIDCDGVSIAKRYIKTKEKSGRVVYYVSKDLAHHLNIYLEDRKTKEIETKAFFISNRRNRYGLRTFNEYLKRVLDKLGIEKNITCHTFRRTINTLRKKMGCPKEDRKILLNHKTKDVNVNSYVKLKYNDFIKLYDTWNPYQDIIL
ncbi:MAG: tyrosine-type recombinase/integrase [Promethearchaeota archaeon]